MDRKINIEKMIEVYHKNKNESIQEIKKDQHQLGSGINIYNNIIDPISMIAHSIYSKHGQYILRKFAHSFLNTQKGGAEGVIVDPGGNWGIRASKDEIKEYDWRKLNTTIPTQFLSIPFDLIYMATLHINFIPAEVEKHILFLGEMHDRRTKELPNLIYNIVKQAVEQNECIDIFIESPLPPWKSIDPKNIPISNPDSKYGDLYTKKEKKKEKKKEEQQGGKYNYLWTLHTLAQKYPNNLRVHSWDLRMNSTMEKEDILKMKVNQNELNINKFLQIAMDFFVNNILNFKQTWGEKEIKDFMKEHSIFKINFKDDEIDTLCNNLLNIRNLLLKEFNKITLFNVEKVDISPAALFSKLDLPQYTLITDIYAFYRMLITFNKKRKHDTDCKKYPKNIIHWSGAKHSTNIMSLFKHLENKEKKSHFYNKMEYFVLGATDPSNDNKPIIDFTDPSKVVTTKKMEFEWDKLLAQFNLSNNKSYSSTTKLEFFSKFQQSLGHGPEDINVEGIIFSPSDLRTILFYPEISKLTLKQLKVDIIKKFPENIPDILIKDNIYLRDGMNINESNFNKLTLYKKSIFVFPRVALPFLYYIYINFIDESNPQEENKNTEVPVSIMDALKSGYSLNFMKDYMSKNPEITDEPGRVMFKDFPRKDIGMIYISKEDNISDLKDKINKINGFDIRINIRDLIISATFTDQTKFYSTKLKNIPLLLKEKSIFAIDFVGVNASAPHK